MREELPLLPAWDDRYATNDLLDRGHPLPFTAQHILEYTLVRIANVDEPFLVRVEVRLEPARTETSWVESYCRPALAAHVPEVFRPPVIRAIHDTIGFMSADEVSRVEEWDPSRR